MMDSCDEGGNESDPHIISSFMGTTDMSFVENSILSYDPRSMVDLVRSEDHEGEGLSGVFQASFHPSSSESTLTSLIQSPLHFSQRQSLSTSPTLQPSLITVSSPTMISSPSVTKDATAQQCSPSAFHSPLGIAPPLHNNRHPSEPLPVFQINLTSPPQGSGHSNADLPSPPIENNETNETQNSSGDVPGVEQQNMSLPLTLHTPPLQEYHMYYPDNQSTTSVTISRNFPNGNSYIPVNGYPYYIPTSSDQTQTHLPYSHDLNHQIQLPHSSLSPDSQPRLDCSVKRSKDRINLNRLKQERVDVGMDNGNCLSNRSTNEQLPYSSFANMDINGDRSALESIDIRMNHRHASGDNNMTQANLLSPVRQSSEAQCSTPNNNTSTPQSVHSLPQNYGMTSPPSLMILESSSQISNRVQLAPVPLQQHLQQQPQHQQHLFQSIQLHNSSLNNHSESSPLTNQDVSLASYQGPPNINPYDSPLNADSLQNATRSLIFKNYDDLIYPNSMQTSNAFVSQNSGFQNKINKMELISDDVKVEEEEAFEKYSSDSFSNIDSDEDSLVIDTSGSGNQGYECGECKKVCRTRGSLRKHLTSEHLSNEPEPAETIYKEYNCPLSICNFTTSLRDELDRHIADHMSEGWTPTGKKRQNKNPLQRHRYNKEEFQCPHCEYSCTVEKAFNRHLAAHDSVSDEIDTPLNKLSCQICGKDRANEAALRFHMKKHRKGKFYKCDICKFKSVQLKKLIQHRRMHTGEKPHLCPYCVYRAARRDNLRSHVRRMHKKNNMFCDTFTPRPLIVAQVEATLPPALHQRKNNRNAHLSPEQRHNHHRPMMALSQHQNSAVPQNCLMERISHGHQQLSQHPQVHQQQPQHQLSPENLGNLVSHGMVVSTFSSQEIFNSTNRGARLAEVVSPGGLHTSGNFTSADHHGVGNDNILVYSASGQELATLTSSQSH